MTMSAYRAALCEDEAVDRDQLAGLCRDIFAARGVEAEVVPFPSADALRRAPEAADFDLYLLDIQMNEGATGLELARWLYSQGVRDRIIFVTGAPGYALEGYDVEPLHYLLKPVDRQRLDDALRRALERQGPKTVRFQWDGAAVPLPLREIRYLESWNHGVVVRLEDRERFFAISLTEAERLLPPRHVPPLPQELPGEPEPGGAGHPFRRPADGRRAPPHEPELLRRLSERPGLPPEPAGRLNPQRQTETK